MFKSTNSDATKAINTSASSSLPEPGDALTDILRAGAQRMLAAAIEQEVADYVDERKDVVDENGRRLVVRNGHLPEREITTGLGPISVKQPRVRDKRPADQRELFSPSLLPKYLRKTKAIEEMIPWLYLKGISTNDFPEALQSLPGSDAKGLSPSTITRLKSAWEDGKHVCNDSPETSQNQGQRHAQRERHDDVQAGSKCREEVAKTPRPAAHS